MPFIGVHAVTGSEERETETSTGTGPDLLLVQIGGRPTGTWNRLNGATNLAGFCKSSLDRFNGHLVHQFAAGAP